MPTFIVLINWTEQGIRDYRETTKRADAFAAAVEKLGGRLVSIHWTVGPYDLVTVVEAPDEETAVAALLQVGAVGNVRTMTMRAFDREAVDRIVAKASG
jgi:uncharacterized protein with GYD domain